MSEKTPNIPSPRTELTMDQLVEEFRHYADFMDDKDIPHEDKVKRELEFEALITGNPHAYEQMLDRMREDFVETAQTAGSIVIQGVPGYPPVS